MMTWRSLPWCLLVLCGSAMADKPNIMFILLDDAGFRDFQSTDPLMRTPNIEKLRQEGLFLNQSYVMPMCAPTRSALLTGRTPNIEKLRQEGLFLNQSYVMPMCAPTRSALLTGRYPHTFGLQDVKALGMTRLYWVNETFSMLPQEMKKLGYKTHMLGKWHLGHCHPSLTPMGRGFDTFYGMLLGAHGSHYTHMKLEASIYDWWDGDKIDWSAKGTYSTSVITTRMLKILREANAREPFFVYLAYFAPHKPFEVPEIYETSYCSHVTNQARRTHCGMMAAVDESIGQIVQVLKDRGLYESTTIIVMSDNGNPGKSNESGSHSYPLRGSKKSVYEGGTRSYTVIRSSDLQVVQNTWPGMIHAIDWMPTILGIARGGTKYWMHGVNQWSRIQRFRSSYRSYFIYTYDDYWRFNHTAYRHNEWKIIRGNPGIHLGWYPPYNLMEDGTAQYEEPPLKSYKSTDIELYNLEQDPYERNDLSGKSTGKKEQLIRELETLLGKYPLQPFEKHPSVKNVRLSDGSLSDCFCHPQGTEPCTQS